MLWYHITYVKNVWIEKCKFDRWAQNWFESKQSVNRFCHKVGEKKHLLLVSLTTPNISNISPFLDKMQFDGKCLWNGKLMNLTEHQTIA